MSSMLNSFVEKTSSNDDNTSSSDNDEESTKKTFESHDGKNNRDEDIEKKLHSKPLDVSSRFPEDKNKHPNPSKQEMFAWNEDSGKLPSSNDVNLQEDPFENSKVNSDRETDLPHGSSFSNVLVSPSPSRSKKGLSRRAYSDPPINERTPLTKSSPEDPNNTGNRMKGYNSFKKSSSTSSDDPTSSSISAGRDNLLDNTEGEREDKTKQTFKSLASLATLTKWWKKNTENKKKKRDKVEEKKMRLKLQYHFMTPFEKYKLGRKPWKLCVQIIKILVVTTQVLLFGADRFASVAFIKNTHRSFQYMFLQNFDGNPDFSLYTRGQLVHLIQHVNTVYHNITETPIGRYWFPQHPPEEVSLCEVLYQYQNNSDKFDYNKRLLTVCEKVSESSNFSRMLVQENYFDRVLKMTIDFELIGIYLNALILGHQPECMNLKVKILIDNSQHDGRLRMDLIIKQKFLTECIDDNYVFKSDGSHLVQNILIAFDVLVISICTVSLVLCLRSVIKSIFLAQAADQYFEEYRNETLTKWDLVELINKWFPVIALSDMLSITGSIYKIYVDQRDIDYYNVTSVFLGVGVICVWVGLLRFFTYFKEYNILLITLRVSAPSLLRFMFCAMFIFIGFTFCGWVVLGAYHDKFQTFLTTAECLYSLVNGDDMYPTFSSMPSRNISIWIFSKLYIYIFVSLFIYLILSTFISIVGDAYERLKDYGRMPPTRIERFISGVKTPRRKTNNKACSRCARGKGLGLSDSHNPLLGSLGGKSGDEDGDAFGGLLTKRVFTNSQLSLVSASLE